MSKQTPRQASKQGQNANKQSNNQSAKQVTPANKQTTSVSTKQNNSAYKPLTRQALKQERRQEERQRRLDEQRRAVRNKRIMRGSLVVVAVVLIAAVAFLIYKAQAKNPASQNQATPTQQIVNSAYPPVDGIYCDALEGTAFHIWSARVRSPAIPDNRSGAVPARRAMRGVSPCLMRRGDW